MIWLRVIFLITAFTMSSGYRWRCYLFCTDQTSTQEDYVEQRDTCRQYAQLKVAMDMHDAGLPPEDKTRKNHLVSLFSQCMGTNGWTVPDGKGEGSKKAEGAVAAAPAVNAAIAPPPSAVAVAQTKTEEKAAITRASECAFARYSASTSSIAATRAQACDLECEHALRAAPGAPRPASCPSNLPARMSKGIEK